MATGTILLPVMAFIVDETDPPFIGFSAGDSVPYLAFDSATPNESATISFRLPSDYASAPLLKIQWSNDGTDTGNVRWEVAIAAVTPNTDADDMTTARTFDTSNTVVDAGVDTRRVQEVEMALTNFDGAVAGDNITLRFSRDAADALDTMDTNGLVFALALEYTTA